MTEEIDKDYNYEEESIKFNSQKKKQDKFDKDAELENMEQHNPDKFYSIMAKRMRSIN